MIDNQNIVMNKFGELYDLYLQKRLLMIDNFRDNQSFLYQFLVGFEDYLNTDTNSSSSMRDALGSPPESILLGDPENTLELITLRKSKLMGTFENYIKRRKDRSSSIIRFNLFPSWYKRPGYCCFIVEVAAEKYNHSVETRKEDLAKKILEKEAKERQIAMPDIAEQYMKQQKHIVKERKEFSMTIGKKSFGLAAKKNGNEKEYEEIYDYIITLCELAVLTNWSEKMILEI